MAAQKRLFEARAAVITAVLRYAAEVHAHGEADDAGLLASVYGAHDELDRALADYVRAAIEGATP